MARILYLTPGLGPCGGIRIIFEHCNRLARRGHEVFLVAPQPQEVRWANVEVPVTTMAATRGAKPFDAVVATGFQTVAPALQIPAPRRYYFVQNMEYTFFPPTSSHWAEARQSYAAAKANEFGVLCIANWHKETLKREWDIDATVVRNGVNRDEFYVSGQQREHAILIEGDDRNPSKDTEGIAWRVGEQLRSEWGVALWGFAAYRHSHADMFDRFKAPYNADEARSMYSQALFLVKASHSEGLACAPVEAMACGTTCARAVDLGDDDLIDGVNCLRVPYNYDALLEAARKLMTDIALRRRLEHNVRVYADKYLAWDPIVDQLECIYGAGGKQ